MTYTVQQGDSLAKIAHKFNMPWERIWDDPQNKELRKLRKSPDVLYPGDQIVIPPKKLKTFKRPTGQYHVFHIRTPKAELKIRIMLNGQPCADTPCTLADAMENPDQTTDKDGKVTFAIKPDLDQAELIVNVAPDNINHRSADDSRDEPYKLQLQIGHLDPANTTTGQKARLTALGFHCPPITDNKDEHVPYVIHRFQKAFIPKYATQKEFKNTENTTGEADSETLAALETQYEQDQSWAQTLTDEDKLNRAENMPPMPVAPNQWNTLNLINGPLVTIDGHMHINSANCCPLPLTWNKLPAHSLMENILRPKRTSMDKGMDVGLTMYINTVENVRKAYARRNKAFAKTATIAIDKCEEIASRLTVTVAETMVRLGYVQSKTLQTVNTAAAKGAGVLLDGLGNELDRNADFFSKSAQMQRSFERNLRSIGEEDAAESAEVTDQNIEIASYIVSEVMDIFNTTADIVDFEAQLTEYAAKVEARMGELCHRAADRMVSISNQINQQMELVQAHATEFIRYVAEQLIGVIGMQAKVSRIVTEALVNLPHKAEVWMEEHVEEQKNWHSFFTTSAKSTTTIGAIAVEENRQTCENLPVYDDSDHLRMMMVMPMDMGFGHIDGYDGKQIYDKVEVRHKMIPILPRFYSKHMKSKLFSLWTYLPPGADPEDYKLPGDIIREIEGPFYYYYKRHGKKGDRKELVWLAKEEFKKFTKYNDQIKETIAAASENPWELLPLYNYDPRRWNKDENFKKETEKFDGEVWEIFPQAWNQPFEDYFSGSGKLFVGIKLYSALGFRPLDDQLDYQKEFYQKCIDLDLPIVCHGSPAGMYSHDRPFYAADDARRTGRDLKDIEEETLKLMEDNNVDSDEVDWRDYYHCEHYVSPRAWDKVLKIYPDLRLCLAHFGGDDNNFSTWREEGNTKKGGDKWDLEKIEMAKKYTNFYIDISYFVMSKYKKQFEEIITDSANRKLWDKIIFGTDWWLVGKDKYTYSSFVNEVKDSLDAIDPDLWYRFSWINPMRFYRIKENKDAIAKGLEAAVSKTITDQENGDIKQEEINKYLKIIEKLEAN